MTRPRTGRSSREDDASVVRHEEELITDTVAREAGRVGIRKVVEHERVATVVAREVEHAEVERQVPGGADSGEVEILAGG